MAYEDAQQQAQKPPTPQRPFGGLLRHYRRLAALSQEALAERAGVSVRAISGMERGEGHTPYVATAQLLADALDLTASERTEFLAAARAPHSATTRLPLAQRPLRQSSVPASGASPWETPAFSPVQHSQHPQPLWRLSDLPVPLTPLIGRAQEVAQVCDLLLRSDVRLLTLCGPPGVGKSRLALQATQTLRDANAFPDGIAFVDLAALSDPAQVIPAIAQALRIQSTSGWALNERLTTILRQRRLLLLLDTCEHVLAAGTEVVALLQTCPRVKALATSRAALRVRGEYELRVQPLALPADAMSAAMPDEAALAEIAASPAVALFVRRAQAVAPEFSLTRANAPAIVAICQRLDGLPLAIELAAARLTVFSSQELLARLEHRLPLLTGAARDLPARQRALRDALAWSYDLLAPHEQAVFRYLAVFAGGMTYEAVEAVLQSALPSTGDAALQPVIADTLAALEQQSLLSIQTLPLAESGALSKARLRLLDTLHEYAEEQLLAAGEAPQARRAHARYFAALAEAAEQAMRQDDTTLCELLSAELENLRAALRWATGEAKRGDSEALTLGLRLGAALGPLWYQLGQASEGSRWLADLLRLARRQPDDEEMQIATEQARALYMAGWLALDQGDRIRAEELLAESVAAYRRLDERGALTDRAHLAEALDRLASARWRQGKVNPTSEALIEALGIRRQLGEPAALAMALLRMGILMMNQGRYDGAEAAFYEALTLYRMEGMKWGIVYTLTYQGELARLMGAPERAAALYEEALALARRSQNRRACAYILSEQGALAQAQTHLNLAKELYRESMVAYRAVGAIGEAALMSLALGDLTCEAGDRQEGLARYQEGLKLLHDVSIADGVIASIERIASLFASANAHQENQEIILRATRLLGLCATVRTRLGFPSSAEDTRRRESALALAWESLGEQRVALAYETGATLTLEQGAAIAQEFGSEGED